MPQSFDEARYSTGVWAGAALAAILAVALGASLWLFFGQLNPIGMKHADRTAIGVSSSLP